jgi:hypothetical protein
MASAFRKVTLASLMEWEWYLPVKRKKWSCNLCVKHPPQSCTLHVVNNCAVDCITPFSKASSMDIISTNFPPLYHNTAKLTLLHHNSKILVLWQSPSIMFNSKINKRLQLHHSNRNIVLLLLVGSLLAVLNCEDLMSGHGHFWVPKAYLVQEETQKEYLLSLELIKGEHTARMWAPFINCTKDCLISWRINFPLRGFVHRLPVV